uniref:t-SNARE coiled-coil homology domain-containing protein n=1 Tax=Mucochytrium quahogii TaxID=96639 RepID=A0A7S2R7A7_9STRA|mmetsp:Transcript_2985/g.4286  ORF Transcript_2985/g.4286 Transcript_2985/m.4286 type:complete len:300 (+) Transcript_2985:158-1057(+)
MAMARRIVEIDDLMERLKLIEREMPQEELGNNGTSKLSDRFLQAKAEFLAGMTVTKDLIAEMRHTKNMHTRDQVAKAHDIRSKLKEQSKLFHEMEVLYSKESRKNKSKLGPEELELRAEFLRQFKNDLEMLKKLSNRAHDGESRVVEGFGSGGGEQTGSSGLFDTASFFNSLPSAGQQKSDGSSPADQRSVELTGVQQQGLDQIRERDQEFDEILEQIGQAVELAGEKAKVMNDEANLQSVMLDKLEEDIDKTKHKMISLNVAMKKNLEDKGMGMERFCINLMCFILFLGIIGIIINMV